MAKKKKGKKGKGKKKEITNEITEVEREIFLIQIADLTAKVERLKTRCLELEASNIEFEENYKQLDEDRGDAINFLKKEAEEKQEEITELEERIEGLVQARENDVSMYKEKIKQNEHDFKIMHENLTSEIKLLSGKLNSLEDFRLQREDLVKKFKKQEEQMTDQEEEHKKVLYEVEKKFIIGKDKLKKEMEGKLLQLSSNFADATEIRIAATTHHAIRENIAINNELDLMIATHCKLVDENEQIKQQDKELKLKLTLVEEEKTILLKRNSVLLKILNRLAKEHEDMELSLAALEHDAQTIADTQVKLELTEEALRQAEYETRIEMQKWHGALFEQDQLQMQAAEAKLRGDKLMTVINECVKAIQEVMNIPEDEDEAYIKNKRETLLARLLQLTDASTIQYIQVPTSDGTERKSVYETGDLGFVPKSHSTSVLTTSGSKSSQPSTESSQSQESHSVSQIDLKHESQRQSRESKRQSAASKHQSTVSKHQSTVSKHQSTASKHHSTASKHHSTASKHQSLKHSRTEPVTSYVKNKSTVSITEHAPQPSNLQIQTKHKTSTVRKTQPSVIEEVIDEIMPEPEKDDEPYDDNDTTDEPPHFADEESGEK